MYKYLSGKRMRYSFGKVRETVPVPDLIEIQNKAYKSFLDEGILSILKKFSPITSSGSKGDVKKLEKGFSLEMSTFLPGRLVSHRSIYRNARKKV